MKPIRFHPEAETEMIQAALWYEKQPDMIIVEAIMHLHRDPDYWKTR